MSLSYCPTLLPRLKSINAKQEWSGWQELNLRGHVPKTCGWPLPYTRTLVARHGIEPYPLAFQTSTLPSSSRAKLGGRCETRTRISRLQAVGNPLIRTAQLGRDERIELS